jgi:atypical dual specificity phosphatase
MAKHRHAFETWIMPKPHGFSWVDKPLLAAMSRPDSADDLSWLRQQGAEVLLSLTEEPPRRDWVNEAGMMQVHVPIVDMEAPTHEQLERCLTAIAKANHRKIGVVVHCTAGMGRTGVVLACYFVDKGLSPQNAIARVRRMRPGSIETDEQAEAVEDFARRRKKGAGT